MPPLHKPGAPSQTAPARVAGSFRDPSGFVFESEGVLYRQINESYRPHFDQLVDSGLYRELTDAGRLVAHEDASGALALTRDAYKVIRPERIPFISYPYEWCFSELKDAALATLDVHKRALARGMILKDATAYNVQFRQCRPVLIDTLSFETYREGEPWVAYRQFCQHFLAPLAIASHIDARLLSLARTHLDGVPLELASRLLPRSTWLRPSLVMHVHLHAKSGRVIGESSKADPKARVSKRGMLGLIDSLESAVRSLRPRGSSNHWSRYYAEHRYEARAFAHKMKVVAGFVERVAPKSVWDVGANTGVFSDICVERGIETIAFDQDHDAVETAYTRYREERTGDKFLPLVLDLSNPSPGVGWAHRERSSLAERGPAEAVLALALIHHLAIANNVPLESVASFFAEFSDWLVIEFVPKEDEQVQRLLVSREDIFRDYDQSAFERTFGARFTIEERVPIHESRRTLYMMRSRG